MALAIDVVKEVGHTNALLDVPQKYLAIVPGGKQDMLISWVRLKHIKLILVPTQNTMQLG